MKIIISNIIALCGCIVFMFALYLISLLFPSASRFGIQIYFTVSFSVFCIANRRVLQKTAILIRVFSVAILSAILSYASFPVSLIIFRTVYVMAGGKNDF